MITLIEMKGGFIWQYTRITGRDTARVRKQKRHRPPAGVEIVAETEHYTVVKLSIPLYGDTTPLFQIYAKPYHDRLFKAFRVGLLIPCKRCKREHCLGWSHYFQTLQQSADAVAYDVLCEDETGVWIVAAGERIPDHLKAYTIFTISSEMKEILTHVYATALTIKDAHNG